MYKFLSLFFYGILSLGAATATLPSSDPTPIVWGGGQVSPFVRKVLIAMEYKGIAYKNQEVMPAVLLRALKQEIPKDFLEASPLGKIPALQEGDFSIADSSVIIAYLEKSHPEQPLYPKNPQLFARALWLEKYGDTVVSTITHTLIMQTIVNPEILKIATDKAAVSEAITDQLPPVLDYLEKQLQAPWAGRYFIGDQMTIADIGVATHLVSLKLLGLKIDSGRYPKLSAYFENILEQPSIKKVLGQ